MSFFGDMYLTFGVSIDFLSICEAVSEALWNTFFPNSSAILLPIKSPVISASFCVTLFKVVLTAPAADILPRSIMF